MSQWMTRAGLVATGSVTRSTRASTSRAESAMDQNARSPNLSASRVITPAMTWARIILSSCVSIEAIGGAPASWTCADDAAGAAGPENSVWNSSWLTATDAASRGHDRVRPASIVHTARESTKDAPTPNQEGAASPATACENAATNVAKAAATVPRATRAHLEFTSRSFPSNAVTEVRCRCRRRLPGSAIHRILLENGVRS
jgi:hypothetical protein